MRSLYTFLLLLLVATCLNAQNIPAGSIKRRIQFRTIGRDSIDLNLNEDYDMIEDSCSVIVRHAHINMRERKFFGAFTDVSKLDPSLVISEGNYTTDGLKNGLFISHYLNGNLKSKGTYKNDKYDGKWETYYEDAKPAMVFEAENDTIRVIDAWAADGKKIVDNGKGNYQVNLGAITWKGKLDNGKPDGTWHAFKTDDATQTSLVDESFKKGKFQKGNSPLKSYTDVSRVILVNSEFFPFARAERMRISAVPCNGTKSKHIVNAQYSNGMQAFTRYISDLAGPAIARFNITTFRNGLILEGKVSEKGGIVDLKSPSPFNSGLAQAIIGQLHGLPPLEPATVDGKPVTQNLIISFLFENGMYTFSFRLLPIKTN